MKVIGIVQARITSKRLPGKILYPLYDGKPLLSVLLQRLQKIDIEWWLATTKNKEDDITAVYGERHGFWVFRGDEADVLSRFESIASLSEADWIVRVTADNPLTDPGAIKALINQAGNATDIVSVISDSLGERKFPQGLIPSIVRCNHLLNLRKSIGNQEQFHLSHVTSKFPYQAHAKLIYKNSNFIPARLTIDEYPDYLAVLTVVNELGEDWCDAGVQEVNKVLNDKPEIVTINSDIIHKSLEEG